MALPDGLQHTVYEHGIPPEVALWLERIYQSPFSTIPYFRIFHHVPQLKALAIATEVSTPVHVLVYVIRGKEVTLLNELVAIEQEYLQYFADFVFTRYPEVSSVNFNCLKNSLIQMPYPLRLWKTSQDITIALPPTPDEYLAQLGRQTQKHIKYYINRLQREFADVVFRVATTQEIDPAVIGTIIEMNRLRMKSKQIHSGYTDAFEKQIKGFCCHYGSASTISVGGVIVAGAICYTVGDHMYLEAIAHDPNYNKYNAGQVCLYLTIKHAIETEKTSFHLLWGQSEYKYRFLGVRQDLYFLSIYRSYRSKVASIPKLAKHTCASLFRQMDYLAKKYIINRFRQR